MVDGVIYRCTECEERFYFTKSYESILKAPCPICDTCTIEKHEDRREPITSKKKVSDLFPDMMKFDGR